MKNVEKSFGSQVYNSHYYFWDSDKKSLAEKHCDNYKLIDQDEYQAIYEYYDYDQFDINGFEKSNKGLIKA